MTARKERTSITLPALLVGNYMVDIIDLASISGIKQHYSVVIF